MPVDKTVASFAEAVSDIPDGATVMIGGFGGAGGMPHLLMLALRDHGARELTIIGNTAGIAAPTGFGWPPGVEPIDHAVLIENGQVRKVIASFPVSGSVSRPNAFERAYKAGEIELEVVPQGTLAERMRAAGAGIPAFYTPTAAGTMLAAGKDTRVFDGREHVLEHALHADFSLVRAQTADTLGNLAYAGTSRTFNPAMAAAGRITIAEVDEVVAPGGIDPERVDTPGIYVQRVVVRPPVSETGVALP
jgi:3-oxoadipate CoA-transferase alpha subunit